MSTSNNIVPITKNINYTTGWNVTEAYFPLKSGTKLPAVTAWNKVIAGVYEAIGDYGINLQADDLVLDFDPRNFKPGENPLMELCTKYTFLPTRITRTPSGGFHLRFKKDPNIKVRKKQPAYQGVDFLSENSYIVGPGSSIKDKGIYILENDIAPAIIPAEFLASLESPASHVAQGIEAPILTELETFKTKCQTWQPASEGQHGDDVTLQLAMQGRDLGLPADIVYQTMSENYNWRCQPPWQENDLFEKVQNAYKYAKSAPGNKTAEAKFKPYIAPVIDIHQPQVDAVMETVHRKALQLNPKTMLPMNTQGNLVYYLREERAWKGRIYYNQFADRVEIKGKPPWRSNQTNKNETIGSFDYAYMRSWFSSTPHIAMETSSNNLREACFAAAIQYHPVRDYLQRLKWDGIERLQNFLPDTLGCENNIYTQEVGKRLMISAVKRIYEPGCKQDYVMVLESMQGTKKSTWVEKLGGEWYSTGELIPNDKDTYQNLRGKWIIELPEIDATFSKAEFAWLKKIITTSADTYRRSYGEYAESVPRESIFIATLNPSASGEYLRDTENRRYWPITTGQFNIEKLIENRDQYFAEAKQCYLNGEPSYIINTDAIRLAKLEQDKRREKDPWTTLLAGWVSAHPQGFTAFEVFSALGFNAKEMASRHRLRIYTVLKQMGYTYNRYNAMGEGQWVKLTWEGLK